MATDGETITISHETRMKLAKLRKVGQSYDSLISNIADQALETPDDENWDVEKIDSDMNKTRKTSTFTSLKTIARR
ncbi:MAG: hypothetical protein PHV39_07875 [Methanomicrobium sp.]|nr:hypothetical protein [Methanomicrobium sp.]